MQENHDLYIGGDLLCAHLLLDGMGNVFHFFYCFYFIVLLAWEVLGITITLYMFGIALSPVRCGGSYFLAQVLKFVVEVTNGCRC